MNQLIYLAQHPADAKPIFGKRQVVNVMSHPKGKAWEQTLSEKTILFVFKGTLALSYDTYINQQIPEGHGLALPTGCHYVASAYSDVTCICFELEDEITLCNKIPKPEIVSSASQHNPVEKMNLLGVNRQLHLFLSNIISSLEDGIMEEEFYKLKTKELFYLLYFYYSKDILYKFFYQLQTNRSVMFTNFVLKNYLNVKTVQELASLSKYSVSGFEKEFRKVFGVSAYKWMTQKKVKRLYHNLRATEKPLKQIVSEMGFTSLSQLNDYCKKHLGLPPRKLRIHPVSSSLFTDGVGKQLSLALSGAAYQ